MEWYSFNAGNYVMTNSKGRTVALLCISTSYKVLVLPIISAACIVHVSQGNTKGYLQIADLRSVGKPYVHSLLIRLIIDLNVVLRLFSILCWTIFGVASILHVSAVVGKEAFVSSFHASATESRATLARYCIQVPAGPRHHCLAGFRLQAGLTDFDILALFGYAATAALNLNLDSDLGHPYTDAPFVMSNSVSPKVFATSTLPSPEHKRHNAHSTSHAKVKLCRFMTQERLPNSNCNCGSCNQTQPI